MNPAFEGLAVLLTGECRFILTQEYIGLVFYRPVFPPPQQRFTQFLVNGNKITLQKMRNILF